MVGDTTIKLGYYEHNGGGDKIKLGYNEYNARGGGGLNMHAVM